MITDCLFCPTVILQENKLCITGCTTNSISVKIGPSNLPDVQGYIIEISSNPISALQQNTAYIQANANNLETMFNNLSPAVLYTFALRIAFTGGSSDVLHTIMQRTRKFVIYPP